MALLSDREGFDRNISNRLAYAEQTQRAAVKPTILEVCEETGFTPPITEQNLKVFIVFCDQWGIETNVSKEKIWLDLLEQANKERH